MFGAEVSLKEEDRKLLKDLANTFAKIGKDISKELKELNKNLVEYNKKK